MVSIFNKAFIKQFLSYFIVGGVSALIEWGAFSLLEYYLGIPYLFATALSFIVSTSANWFLGRNFTFRNSIYKNKKAKEFILVFIVSIVGLFLNLMIMFVLVEIIMLNSSFMQIFDKIISTGIVFVWNFLARKFLIYRTLT